MSKTVKEDIRRCIKCILPETLPNVHLEQYTTPSNVAAEILYLAAYVHDDIIGKTVVELGCGTGRLAIGSALLGAQEVVGVDLDGFAVRVAQKYADIMGVKDRVHCIVADIDAINGNFDIVLQNPPFGVQRRRADRKFISKSLELSNTIYSFHKGGESNRDFIKRFIEGHGGRVTHIFPLKMEIPRMFKFHTKKRRSIKVDLYRIEGKNT